MATFSEAEAYCESLFFAKKTIQEAVASARAQQRAERLEFDMRTGGDSTARRALQDLTPIAVVRCVYAGQSFIVYQPEIWLKVMDKSLLLFRQRFGDAAYETVRHRFLYHWSSTKIVAQENISRQSFQVRRRDFLNGLMILAAQENLISVDADRDSLLTDMKKPRVMRGFS